MLFAVKVSLRGWSQTACPRLALEGLSLNANELRFDHLGHGMILCQSASRVR